MIDWIAGLPWVVLAVLFVGTFAAFSTAGLAITRRWILPRFGHGAHQNEVTGAVVHGILIVYGLAVALLAIAVWENYAAVEKIVSAEAVAIGSIYRDAGGYPEPARTHLRERIKSYTEQIVQEAWPLHRKGETPTRGVEYMDWLQSELFKFEPATEGQRALHQETLRAYNTLIQARRLRVDTVKGGLPAPMWAVILIGGLITLASAFFFDVGSVRLHRLMIVLLSSIMGLLIFLIAYYDRPYRGSHGISPEAYELIYDQLMKH